VDERLFELAWACILVFCPSCAMPHQLDLLSDLDVLGQLQSISPKNADIIMICRKAFLQKLQALQELVNWF
jgi:hypothetical protein